MQLRSGKTTFSVLKQQPVDDTNVFGTKTFIKTGLKYIEDINNTFIEETQSGVIRKIKKCMSMFEYFYNTMFTPFNISNADFIIKLIQNTNKHSYNKTIMATYNPPHYRDENTWEIIPDTEVDRLQTTLSNHLRSMKVKKDKKERIQIVKGILEKQNNTCAFGKDVSGKWCWNESKVNFTKTKKEKGEYSELKYIKLQWGHIKPRCRNESQSINDLCLLCARCNNQIQTSRHLIQIEKELESKILHIKQFLQERQSGV